MHQWMDKKVGKATEDFARLGEVNLEYFQESERRNDETMYNDETRSVCQGQTYVISIP